MANKSNRNRVFLDDKTEDEDLSVQIIDQTVEVINLCDTLSQESIVVDEQQTVSTKNTCSTNEPGVTIDLNTPPTENTSNTNITDLPTSTIENKYHSNGEIACDNLQNELQQLREENEKLKVQIDSLKNDAGRNIEKTTDDNDQIIFSISFVNRQHFNSHKNTIAAVLKDHAGFHLELDEETMTMQAEKQLSKKKKRKSKRKQCNEFVLDTTPSATSKNNSVQYVSQFSVEEAEKGINSTGENSQGNGQGSSSMCFNCSGNHSLRDCIEPRDQQKINASRQLFKSQQSRNVRYHLEQEQLYAHLKPGQISDKLQEALGLQKNQIPEHIYRMRALGYPPGWLSEVSGSKSNLVLFETDGKTEKRKRLEEFNPDLIVEYPGFNIPPAKKVKDECRSFRCPPYSFRQSKEVMVKDLQERWKKDADNLETCDMDIDTAIAEDVSAAPITPSPVQLTTTTLDELEMKKEKILAALSESNADSSQDSEAFFETLDEAVDSTSKFDFTFSEDLNKSSEIKESQLGTPVLKSSSHFSKLPSPENFQKNMSDVINFENLPNSTGNYEHLTNVLDRVRKNLKAINEQR